MIGWVEEKLKTWGEAKRRVNGAQKPPSSIIGRFIGGWTIKAAGGAVRPCPPEVMLDDALITARAIQLAKESGDLNLRHYEVLYVRYVLHGSRRKKILALGISESYFHRVLNRAHVILSGPLAQCATDHDKLKEIQMLQCGA